MELEQEDGNSIPIEAGSPTLIGRDLGLVFGSSSSDRFISRHHVSLQFLDNRDDKVDASDQAEELLLSFEVVGKNPVLVCGKDGEGKRIYRKSEKGVLKAGDRISLSIRNPNFLFVKRREGRKGEVESSVLEALARRERRTRQRRKEAEERANLVEVGGETEVAAWEGSGLGIGSLDVSEIDPVKEFGFLVNGHEFDRYPRHKIRPFKDWNWFLEDPRGVSNEYDEEDDAFGAMTGKHQKKKKGGDNDDEDWDGENQDVNTLAANPGSAKRPRYSTRSKDSKKQLVNIPGHKKLVIKGFNGGQKEVGNEDDETLGGFIVGDDDVEEEEEIAEEETEEEEEEGDDEESDVD
ncbi:uncharacterized protein LOC110097402 [Dendrobium catenatum]|uniref:FHA domain-containing protein n=1 Tax=Dendrobium catenatum TaxID=906689 RepID=A0A2I0WCI5_9ASPA|nr:uncharacterized protein LOC110097402 [Dendrobium catenatum]PKU73367.1 hypothetical protein MA16_Dca026386 [Dendrobium catenatum]